MKEAPIEPTEQERRDWKLDPEASYAELCITPIEMPSRRVYQYETRLDIRPYPNPLRMGGYWGTGGAGTLTRLKQVIRGFYRELDPWVARGLTRISIAKRPPIYQAEREPPQTPGERSEPSVAQRRKVQPEQIRLM